ncbi:MAG: SPFH domain-containing protein, partial [Planctomycetota bacterium]
MWPLVVIALVVFFVTMLLFWATRYKRCPSDRILVVYGRVGAGKAALCLHGGGKFIWPLVQDYRFLSLTPITIGIPLQNALSLQNIRINVPSTFTVGVSTHPAIMNNAAERLLGLRPNEIEEMAKEIIFGQLRLTVASLTIEQINQDRESFLESIRKNVEPELNKIGLYLINVNITDITDESEYIESIGKKAAAEAVNKAKVDVAVQEKIGAIGNAEAIRERDIRVAENLAAAEKGKKKAEADRRVYTQGQEAEAITGENKAKADIAQTNAVLDIKVAENVAAAEKGKKKAEADRRVYVQGQEAEAIRGENTAKADIAEFNATLAIKQAEALQQGEVAKREAEVNIQKAQARAETERLTAAEVVQQEINRRKIEIAAEAEGARLHKIAQGQAQATLARYDAEARGTKQVLDAKAEGYRHLVESCGSDAKAAATFLMVEKIEEIVARQVEAIKNLRIDKITVWDTGTGRGGKNATADFVSGLIKSLPPIQDVAGMAGVELPAYLGKITPNEPEPGKPAAKGPARG